jgi:hypothetical protein
VIENLVATVAAERIIPALEPDQFRVFQFIDCNFEAIAVAESTFKIEFDSYLSLSNTKPCS